MTLAEVVEVLAEYGDPESFRRAPDDHDGLCVSSEDFSLFAYGDSEGRLAEIEVSSGVSALLGSLDLLGARVEEVLEVLKRRWEVRDSTEEPGYSYDVPALGLGLWRNVVPEDENDEEGSHFDSVLNAAIE
jgi:hypothetical protein